MTADHRLLIRCGDGASGLPCAAEGVDVTIVACTTCDAPPRVPCRGGDKVHRDRLLCALLVQSDPNLVAEVLAKYADHLAQRTVRPGQAVAS